MDNLIFNELNVSKEILKAVEKMGFEEATPIQSMAITHLLDGRDVTAQAPTGTGKTCAFGIPIIERTDTDNPNIQTVILAPTRELVIQIAEELSKLAVYKKQIRMVPIYGGQQIDRQIMALKRKPQIIVATPGRLMDHMRRRTVRLENLKCIVLDEADEMLNMGFREDIDEILKSVPEERQTALFSATISDEIKRITAKYQTNAEFIRVVHKELTVPTVEQFYLEVRGRAKIDVLTHLIDTNTFKLSLVFCNTKRMVDELTSDLNSRGYNAEALHGDMRQASRDKVMNKYRRGKVDILVATDVAARGIDVDDVEAVFNYDLPNDEEYYVHRIGRTGRAKRTGVSYTFVSGREMYKLKEIMRYTKASIKLMVPPSVSDVEERRLKLVVDDIKHTVDNGKMTRYIEYIEKFVDMDDDLTILDVAAALLNLNMNGGREKEKPAEEPRQKLRRTKGNSRGASNGMSRMFMNLGTLDKLRPDKVLALVCDNTSLNSSDIGAINIYDKYSFFEVPKNNTDEVIIALTGQKYNNRSVNIERASKR